MSDPSYSVDDILKEVRKRREENEALVKGVSKDEPDSTYEENNNAEADPADNGEDEDYSENAEKIIEESFAEENASSEAENEKENSGKHEKESEEEALPEKDTADISDDFTSNDNGEVDLYSLTGDTEKYSADAVKEKQKWSKTKKGKIFISIIVILLVAVVGAGIYAYYYINNALNTVTDNEDKPVAVEDWSGMDKLVENFDPIYEDPKSQISSLRDMIKTWYYNGTPCSSTHVLNILLIGEDTREEDIEEEGTRADSAIIASVNIDTGTITLTSILRDAYVYWETTEGDKKTGQFGKINGAMSTGGIDCYIRCVENMYKVNIDNYVLVNFDSFESIVDALGGVTVEMTAAEINEINNHQKRYDHVTIDAEPGPVKLDGYQALAYCRIRKIDSDSARADRQKTVLLQLFNDMKDASTIKTVEVVNALVPYVKTGIPKNEIISIGKYAMKHGWLNYETQTFTVPANETKDDGTVITTCKGGTYYGAWVWKVDYPLAAQIMQTNIYGKTSIVLAEKRPDFLKLSEY